LALVCLAAVVAGLAGWHLLAVPVLILLQLMFTCGVAWILAPVAVIVRDVQYMLQYLSMILLVVSPIGFTLDNVPPALAPLVYINPLTYFLVGYQSVIVHDQLPSLTIGLACLAISLVSFVAGYWLFARARQVFIDYV
jgi:lipopolysaccharide transport system permease protein